MGSLDYKVVHFTEVTDQFDSVVIVGEDLKSEHYPEFAKPYVSAIKSLSEVR